MTRLCKLLILLLMLLLPAQGIAAVLSPLHKVTNASPASAMPCHQHDESQSAHAGLPSTDEHHTGGVAHDADGTNHLCCHQVLSYITMRWLNAAAHKFSDVSRFVSPLATLFIPDSPDRPPRG
jgi:hypothetical protein